MKHVWFVTNGCPETRIDVALLQAQFAGAGWNIAADASNADLIVYNACSLTQENEDASMRIIAALKKRKKPAAELVVYGCLPCVNLQRLRTLYDGFTCGANETGMLLQRYGIAEAEQKTANQLVPLTRCLDRFSLLREKLRAIDPWLFVSKIVERFWQQESAKTTVGKKGSYCLKIATGCLSQCAYCSIKLSRGRLQSKTIAQITGEFREGLQQGFQEFALIGTDVGSYGRDNATNLARLLEALFKEPGAYTVHLRNLHPRFLIDMLADLIPLFQTGRISHLLSAIQSGSNDVLRAMRRGYTVEAFEDALRTIQHECPALQVRTQFIIGFPGETEADFKASLAVLERDITYDFAEVYTFQARPGTEAAALPDQVPLRTVRQRHIRMLRALFKHARRVKNLRRPYRKV